MSVCILGAGVSGILLTLLLAETSIPLETIYIIDPHFDGGDLSRKWSTVISNTPWSVTLLSIKTHLPSLQIPKWAEMLPLDAPTPVCIIAKLLRESSGQILKRVNIIQDYATGANWSTATSRWTISVKGGRQIISKAVCFAVGGTPKALDICVPSIPLEVALDVGRLKTYIEPHSKVIVFGTRHSGVHVLKNLVDCSANSIVGIYKNTSGNPFVYARDGVYDGIKLDAATIADEILANKYPNITLLPTTDLSTILRETRNADWVVYAIGFEPHVLDISVDTTPISCSDYDPTCGMIKNCQSAWGFGLAYPSQAPDGIHFDVGVSSFLEHIHKQIPSIVSTVLS
jgi:hypothetical protein